MIYAILLIIVAVILAVIKLFFIDKKVKPVKEGKGADADDEWNKQYDDLLKSFKKRN